MPKGPQWPEELDRSKRVQQLAQIHSFIASTTHDKEGYDERAAFAKVRRAENDYGRRLRQVAKHIEDLVRAFAGAEMDLAHLEQLLHRYSALIEPWARAVASRFVAEVARRDEQACWASRVS